ncbi:hypothetical protein ONE63_002174 [Megalurothrips usitatus]|uniref:C2H2-type domain-containing protein n=1 Tax=Megalurothrips usitatus TaxID=439358 RepID=A0AAV7XED8_9NEOP|nr:hypothetical protein ONE63_002174 [Megalurothrips usitatus]
MGNSPTSGCSVNGKKMLQGRSVCGSESPTRVETTFSSYNDSLLNDLSLNNGPVIFGSDVNLQEHYKSSTAHALRMKFGEEFAIRRSKIAADYSDSTRKYNDLAFNQNSGERECKNDASIKEGSRSKISRYYCGPCSSYVSKINVLLHESSEKHRQCCYAWVRGSDGLLQVKQETGTPVHTSGKWIEKHNGCESDSQVKVDVRASISEQFLEMMKKYLSLEKFVKLQKGGFYFCSKCELSTSVFKMMAHVIKMDHLHKSSANRENLGVMEEKENILKHMLEVKSMVKFGKSALKNIRTVINIARYNVSRLPRKGTALLPVEKGCRLSDPPSSDEKDLIDTESEAFDLSDDEENVMPSIVVEKVSNSSHSSYHEEILGKIVAPVSCNSGWKTIRTDEVSEKEVNEATDEYFSLEDVSTVGGSSLNFKCELCNICNCKKKMFSHILTENHMNSSWAKRQTRTTVNGKLELLAFFLLLLSENQKWETLSCCSIGLFTRAMARLKGLTELGNVGLTPVDHALKPGLCTQTPLTGSSFYEASSMHSECVNQEEKCKSLEGQECASIATQKLDNSSIFIGGSESVNLNDEIDQICADKDIDDFEFECETCGGVFPIFNHDFKLSMDMHFQSPVHSLATAVPVERNASSVAEISKDSKTSNFPALGFSTAVTDGKKAVSFRKMTQDLTTLNSPALVHQNSANSELSFQERRSIVISEVFLLEQNYVVEQNGFNCKLCEVQLKTKIQMFHHLISTTHLNKEWSNSQTSEALNQKSKTISLLMRHRYSVAALGNAAFWINQLSLAKRRGVSLPNETMRVNSMVMKPSKHETKHAVDKPDRKLHHDISQRTQNLPKQHGRDLSNTFFCEVCNKKMSINSQISHLSGKSHQSKISAVLKNLASGLSSLKFEGNSANVDD